MTWPMGNRPSCGLKTRTLPSLCGSESTGIIAPLGVDTQIRGALHALHFSVMNLAIRLPRTRSSASPTRQCRQATGVVLPLARG